ncbi:SDR family oxidoreductase [Nocardiopsis sp. RSe5-2]|uniref:SDR family oxidoreductase n=1 Tax=Nocardiopsis endophytica TaxID=3018445 RepID=A0ABT4U833_9ACTN|nr:SDR family oxidoreductase [Nocardiopsis endophytica]MDA2812886.1 SDR family oxidoreductase [Nocardiopsis endophytica]
MMNPEQGRPAAPGAVPRPGHGLLRGRTALVTAAAGTGIGGAAARRLLEEGARVVVSDAHERRLAECERALAAEFGADRVAAVRCDVTDEEHVQAAFDAAERRFGPPDVVVNNAGLGGTAPLAEMEDAEWSRVLEVTLTGTMRCTRAAMRRMVPRGGGAVVNNASVLGWRAQPGQAHYAAAKAGVMALTRCAAMEAAPHGVRINAVAPSLAVHENLAKSAPAELLEELARREAFGRAAEPWEVANVIVFLASDYASYMTGEVVPVSSQRA